MIRRLVQPRVLLQRRIQGPWPFVTRGSYTSDGRQRIWRSRPHRKGLDLRGGEAHASARRFWQAASYNWSIGALFATGSILFILGSALSLLQTRAPGISTLLINITFFLGSMPFTAAAFMQLVQAANTSDFEEEPKAPRARRLALVGWYPRHAGWLSSLTQFLGTLAFNAETLNAVFNPSKWYLKDAAVWLPDIIGSVFFLISGYLAFLEIGHRYWTWRPKDLSWQIVFINLLGGIAFMTAALLGYYPPGTESGWIVTLSTVHTLIGAACFLIGASLTCRESGWRVHHKRPSRTCHPTSEPTNPTPNIKLKP